MTEWLDQCISDAWQSHTNSEKSRDASLRMELRAMQQQNPTLEAVGTQSAHETHSYRPDNVWLPASVMPQISHTNQPPGFEATHSTIRGHKERDYAGRMEDLNVNLGDRGLWQEMLQAVSTCASSLAQHLASSCYEVDQIKALGTRISWWHLS